MVLDDIGAFRLTFNPKPITRETMIRATVLIVSTLVSTLISLVCTFAVLYMAMRIGFALVGYLNRH
jgi:hypothetical protein